MPQALAASSPLVSPRAQLLILSSPRLRRMLAPGDPLGSPYEVLDYEATLTLHDPEGLRATFWRRQAVRFLQDGIAGILDHVGCVPSSGVKASPALSSPFMLLAPPVAAG